MGKEGTGGRIHCRYLRHFHCAEFKIQDVEVFYHVFFANGFSQRNNAMLIDPAQDYLPDTLAVLTGVLQPELGGNKEFIACNTALFQCITHLCLILIRGGGID